MTDAPIETRNARPEEMSGTVSTLVAAFVADPVARFMCPTADEYLSTMPLFFREFGGAAFAHEGALVSADLRGAALWLPPGVHPDEDALDKLLRERTRPQRLDDVLLTFETMGRSHPEEEHWYLPLIGVDPCAQGRGLGAALLRHTLARCDAEQRLAYLESSNPRNISLYERHGFEGMGEIRIGAAPVVTPMLRRPRVLGRDSMVG